MNCPSQEELFWFIGEHLNKPVDMNKLKFTFNKSMIINEKELVEIVEIVE